MDANLLGASTGICIMYETTTKLVIAYRRLPGTRVSRVYEKENKRQYSNNTRELLFPQPRLQESLLKQRGSRPVKAARTTGEFHLQLVSQSLNRHFHLPLTTTTTTTAASAPSTSLPSSFQSSLYPSILSLGRQVCFLSIVDS